MPVSRGGLRALSDASPDSASSAYNLLGDGAPTGHPVEIDLPPGMLDDLHHPALVISPGYVGPERRRWADRRWADQRWADRRSGLHRHPIGRRPGRGLRLSETIMVIAVTVAAVVPLTLILSHGPTPASSARRSPPRSAAVSARAAGAVPTARRHPAPRQPRAARLAGGRSATTGKSAAGAATAVSSCTAPATPALTARCARRQAAIERHVRVAALRATRQARRRSSARGTAVDT